MAVLAHLGSSFGPFDQPQELSRCDQCALGANLLETEFRYVIVCVFGTTVKPTSLDS